VDQRTVEVVEKNGLWRVVEGVFIMSSHRSRDEAVAAAGRRLGGRGRLQVRSADGRVEVLRIVGAGAYHDPLDAPNAS
jgi:hypothetical protein